VTASALPSTAREPDRVLFVDDDRQLVEGLRDALRPFRRRWAMTFVTSAEDALDVLDDKPHDIVVSDLRMPGTDGATLLARVGADYPETVRIVLSGQADLRTIARAAGVAHRLLAKPCEIDELTRVIERSCSLKEMTERVELGRRLAGASALPSAPRLYVQLTEMLRTGEASAEDAARLVERDVAMTAKVLQLANSAYFCRRDPVSKVRDAVAYLGLEALRALALSAETFKQFMVDPPIPGFSIDALELHSCRVARLAHLLSKEASGAQEAFAAGLLHDVGLLVMAAEQRDALAETIATSVRDGRPTHEVELERHGVTHAELGAICWRSGGCGCP
jgi:CheY-like chemotaxis protein